jgi:hypothetical protein
MKATATVLMIFALVFAAGCGGDDDPVNPGGGGGGGGGEDDFSMSVSGAGTVTMTDADLVVIASGSTDRIAITGAVTTKSSSYAIGFTVPIPESYPTSYDLHVSGGTYPDAVAMGYGEIHVGDGGGTGWEALDAEDVGSFTLTSYDGSKVVATFTFSVTVEEQATQATETRAVTGGSLNLAVDSVLP